MFAFKMAKDWNKRNKLQEKKGRLRPSSVGSLFGYVYYYNVPCMSEDLFILFYYLAFIFQQGSLSYKIKNYIRNYDVCDMQFTICCEVYARMPRKNTQISANCFKKIKVLAYITIKWVILVYEYI